MNLNDSLTSLATNLGQKLNGVRYTSSGEVSREELLALWVTSWVAQKACAKKASDMVRRWREIRSNDLTSEQIEQFSKLEKKYKIPQTLERASKWCSFYGGVGLLVITNANVETPLSSDQRLERIIIVPPNKITGVGQRNIDILSTNYGLFDTYRINGLVEVHHSRLIIMNAVERDLESLELFGYSDLQAVYETVKRFDFLQTNIADLVSESKVDVFKIPELNASLLAGRENDIAKTMQQVQLIKSTTNSLLIDGEYEHEQKELTFTGLTDLIREFRNAVAGACDMPVTILFGQSVSGLASGDEDTENYHETIHRLQELRLRPVLEVLDVLLLAEVTNKPIDDFWFEFNSLKDNTVEQRLNMFSQFASGAVSLIQSGVLTEEQVARELRDLGLVNCISNEDLEMLSGIDYEHSEPTISVYPSEHERENETGQKDS